MDFFREDSTCSFAGRGSWLLWAEQGTSSANKKTLAPDALYLLCPKMINSLRSARASKQTLSRSPLQRELAVVARHHTRFAGLSPSRSQLLTNAALCHEPRFLTCFASTAHGCFEQSRAHPAPTKRRWHRMRSTCSAQK